MALRHFSARGLIGVLAAGLLMAGCTPDPGTTPTVAPTPSATQASPSASPTPTQTESPEEQKQREAFEAAEKAYRTNFAEVGRLAMAGGADEPTRVLRATSKGDYLDMQMESLRYLSSEHVKASSGGTLGWVRPDTYSPTTLTIVGCEDFRAVQLIKDSGETVAPEGADQRIAEQTITVGLSAGGWKLAGAKSKQVSRC